MAMMLLGLPVCLSACLSVCLCVALLWQRSARTLVVGTYYGGQSTWHNSTEA